MNKFHTMKDQYLGTGRLACLMLAAILAGCGGGMDGTATPEAATRETAKERAALERARALNADAMGRIKAERAATQNK